VESEEVDGEDRARGRVEVGRQIGYVLLLAVAPE
jgi:hypothetical protein